MMELYGCNAGNSLASLPKILGNRLVGAPRRSVMANGIPPRPASYDKKVGLVLQGGGALGSYQAGVYEALASSEYAPDWLAGVSIGAINGAIIAGNAPKDRVTRLPRFWEERTAPTLLWPRTTGPLAVGQRWASALMAIAFGQPGFFAPQRTWFPPDKRVSYYTTSARN